MADLDSSLRRHIYDLTLARGVPPSIAELSDATVALEDDVRGGLERLAAARIVVLQPSTGEILMAPPFSAVPTPFLVKTPGYSTYANCAWDALGVAVMLRQPVRIITACACCGDAVTLDVAHDAPPTSSDVVHFAVPAARWWQDVVFT